MLTEAGHFALILALVLALAQGVFPLLDPTRGDLTLMRVAPATALVPGSAMARTAPVSTVARARAQDLLGANGIGEQS